MIDKKTDLKMKKTLFYSMAVVALGCLAVACNQNSDKNGQQQASSTNEIQMVDATSDTLDTRKPIVKNDKDVEVSIDNVPQVAKDLLAKCALIISLAGCGNCS